MTSAQTTTRPAPGERQVRGEHATRRSGRSFPGRLRTAALTLAVVGGFCAPLDSLRIAPIGGLADVLLIGSAVLLMVRRSLGGPPPLIGPYVRIPLAVAVLVIAGLIGTLFVGGDALGSGGNIARFSLTVGGLPMLMSMLRPTRPEVRCLCWSFVLGSALSGLVAASLASSPGRSAGLAVHPNALGLSCALAFCVVLGLRTAGPRLGRSLAFAVGGFTLIGVSASGSRAAALCVAVGGAVYLLLSRRFKTVTAGLACALLVVGALGTGLYDPPRESALGRILYEPESALESDLGRQRLQDEVFERVDVNLLTGSGFGHATQGHNVYLQILDIAGLLGIVGYTALVVAVLRRPWRFRSDPLVAGGAAMVVGYLASAPFSNTIWDRWLWFPIAVTLAATTNGEVCRASATQQRATSPIVASSWSS